MFFLLQVLKVQWLPPRSEDKCSVQRYLIRLKTDTSTRSFTKKVSNACSPATIGGSLNVPPMDRTL